MANKSAHQKKGHLTVETANHGQAEIQKTRLEVASATFHRGPLPDAETLQNYEIICPGAADRIIAMAEEQAKHRQNIEKIAVKSKTRDSMAGIICAFALGAITVISGAYVIIQGYAWSGSFLGTAGLGGLVGTFVYGTRSSRQERQQKAQENP